MVDRVYTFPVCNIIHKLSRIFIFGESHSLGVVGLQNHFKMAAFGFSQGYTYEFTDCVPDYLYCKKCTLVARKINITTCCGESYCHVCITDTRKEGKPCPSCGEKDYNSIGHIKNQKQINILQVYCSMKEKECDWSGTLEQLDTHLDPDQDNCQYVDTKCPLNCHMTIPKNKVEQHVAQHCAKRPYVCQHCNFKATYKEVVDEHLPECKYVPLQCPNLCGVTFERDFMEDHMKMCRLEEVRCEFSGVGCDVQFKREDQEEHTRQNSQKHLTLTASLAVETIEQFQQKLLDQDKKKRMKEEKLKQKIEKQDKKIEEQEKKLKEEKQKLGRHEKKLEEQEKKLGELKEKLVNQEKKLEEEEEKRQQQDKKLEEQEEKRQQQDKKLEEQEKKVEEQNKKLKVQENNFENERKKEEQKLKEKIEKLNKIQKQKLDEHKQLLEQQFNSKLQKLEQMLKEVADKSIQTEGKLFKMSSIIYFNRRFEMKNFSREKARDKTDDWYSPAMYSHVCGYKFCIRVEANGYFHGRGKSMYVAVNAMPGQFDDQLKWPVRAMFTIELINQQGGEDASFGGTWTWNKPTTTCEFVGCFYRIAGGFMEHSKLNSFLNNDTLYFCISEVRLL